MSEELRYMNRPMNPEPVNLPLSAVATALRDGDSIVAILEPGDATVYRLCVVPCWAAGVRADLRGVGIPPENARDYLLVTRFNGHGGDVFFASNIIEAFDLDVIQNGWSRELLSWWVRRLWKELEEI